MNLSSGITLSYAVLLIIGGVMGYVKAGSLASLIMGTAFGCSLLASWWASYRQVGSSKIITLCLMGILACFFAYRFAVTGNFWPTGAILSFNMLALLVLLSEKCCCKSTCKDARMTKS